MGVQVGHDKYDLTSVRLVDIHQISDFFAPSSYSTVFPDSYMPHAAQRLHKHKYAVGAVSGILGINFLCHGQGVSGLLKQLVWHFIHAYDWDSRVIQHLVNVQDILLAGYEFYVSFERNAPIFVRPKFYFFNVWRMAFSYRDIKRNAGFFLKAGVSSANASPG